MFGFNFDKRVLYIILIFIIIRGFIPYLTDQEVLIGTLVTIPAVLIAITFHEFAHGYAAYKLGDTTAKDQGRLNLNPLSHLDPVGTIMLLFAGFGWGKPVEINPRNFNRDIPMTRAEAIVAAAGPLMNIVLAIVFAFVYYLILKYSPQYYFSKGGDIVRTILSSCIITNVGLGIFNLIPLPPLDGSKILKNFLSFNAREWFEKNEHIFYIAFVVLWVTGFAGSIISPAIRWVYTWIITLVKAIVRI